MFSSLFQRAVTHRVLPTCRRYLSSQMPLIASPSYYVYGADTMLAFKVIPPTFKLLRNNSVVLDSNRKGRLLLEWSPRAATFGGVDREKQIRFALSAEEVGLLLDQLPNREVEYVRKTPEDQVSDTNKALKVLRITPGSGGQFSFKVNFENDTEGDDVPSSVADHSSKELEAVLELGEYMVVRQLMQESIPALTGWSVQLQLAMQAAVHNAGQPPPYQQGPSSSVPF